MPSERTDIARNVHSPLPEPDGLIHPYVPAQLQGLRDHLSAAMGADFYATEALFRQITEPQQEPHQEADIW